MRVFELENRLTSDQCASAHKELQNKSITEYILYNMYPTASCDDNKQNLSELVVNNPNLRYRDGYGIANACVVDEDSKMRDNPSGLTHFRDKQQLCSRWHQAVPDYGRGGVIPNVESALKMSADTSYLRGCDRIVEKQYDTFIPFNTCGILNPDVVPPFKHLVMTRDFVREDDYARRCGLMPKQIVQ